MMTKSQNKRSVSVDMLHGSIGRALLIFAIPVMISSMFQQLYNTVDTMIVGNVLGDSALAAIGAGTPIYNLLVGFALGIGNGLSMVTARTFGSGKQEALKKSVAYAGIISAATALVITLVSYICIHPLLLLLRTPDTILEETESYIGTITLFTAVMLAYNICSGLLRAIGNSLMPLIFLVVSSLLNVVLDYLFVAVLNYGIRGAAVATVISQGVSVVLSIIYIGKHCKILIPEARHFRIEKGLFHEMLAQGLSSGFIQSVVAAGTVILQFGINGLGDLTIAAHTVARKIFSFFALPFVPLSTAVTTFVSQNRGANQWERIRKAVRYSILFSVGITVFIVLLLGPTAGWMMKWISGSTNATVLENGTRYLLITAPFYAVLGVLFTLRCALQGMGEKILPFLSSVIELLGKILFVILFIPRWGYTAVIFCEPIIWCFMTAQLLFSFYKNPYIKAAARSSC